MWHTVVLIALWNPPKYSVYLHKYELKYQQTDAQAVQLDKERLID